VKKGLPRLYNKAARKAVLAEINKFLKNPDCIEGRLLLVPFEFNCDYYCVRVDIR
jgi:hypothetical protein